MDFFISVLIPVAIFAATAFVIGFLLAVASRVFSVKKDERIEKITELLPGANCGACGYSGCSDYAEAMVKNGAPADKCKVGDSENMKRIAEVLGKDVSVGRRMRAQVFCLGTTELASGKYIYKGLNDCLSVAKLGNGPKECSHGCIGLGTCVKACPFGAIKIDNGVASVEYEKCKACGVCSDVCPQGIIKLIPFDSDFWVGCSSLAGGKEVRSFCNIGCIGCGICVKNCPVGAITVEDNLARIDYDKCIGCGACEEKCPRKTIRSGKKKEISDTVSVTSSSKDSASEDNEIGKRSRFGKTAAVDEDVKTSVRRFWVKRKSVSDKEGKTSESDFERVSESESKSEYKK